MLTARQQDCLSYIRRYQDEHGEVSPSFCEMQSALGLASKSGVHRLLSGLEDRGYIRRLPDRARAIEIIKDRTLASASTDALWEELDRRGALG